MEHITPSNIAVIGGGPAGLMAAESLADAGLAVTIYERMPSPARKFLMAGRGGLNLTHSEPLEAFLSRYGDARNKLTGAIHSKPPSALREWCERLDQPTFVGTSGRIFPQAMKASPLLRAWLKRLGKAGVHLKLRHYWRGWDEAGALLFDTPNGRAQVRSDATILALGGASWPRLGSDGSWCAILSDAGIAISALKPANCGFRTSWSDLFRLRFQGQPLKAISLSLDRHSLRGEVVITRSGLEGSGIYALSAALRDAIGVHGEARLLIDLRPDTSFAELRERLNAPRNKQSFSTFLRKRIGLQPVAVGLLHEAALKIGESPSAMSSDRIASLVKAVPVILTEPEPIERAISTSGGISWDEIDENFMLRRLPGTFAAGEMLDWEAPTGGYLLQACFATGAAAGRGVLRWLSAHADPQG